MGYVTGSSKKGKDKKRATTDYGGSSAEAFQPVPIQVEIPPQGGQIFGENFYEDQQLNQTFPDDEQFDNVFLQDEQNEDQPDDPSTFQNRHGIIFATPTHIS